MRRSGVLRLISDKKGASLAFVLGILLLLMAVGLSVLVAAEAGAGFMLSQAEYNSARLLDSSIHRSIMFSLQSDPENGALLSRQLAMAVYKANDPDYLTTAYSLDNMPLELALSGAEVIGGDISIESITLSFPTQNVFITPAIPAIPPTEQVLDEDGSVLVPYDPGTPRVPKTATLDASMTVTVVISVGGRRLSSRALYEYTGGRLSDEAVEGTMEFTGSGFGAWRLTSHEKVDS